MSSVPVSTTTVEEAFMKPLQHGSTQLQPGPFRTAQDLNIDYVLSLDPDRLLAPYRTEAGIDSPAPSYGNWENSGLDGHTLGHVLSAAAHIFSATGDTRASQLVEKLVDGVADTQNAIGTGYVGGVPHGQELWARIAAGDVEPDSFGLNGAWVPWYNLHKLFAGLIDAHKLTASATALDVVTRLANWWLEIARTLSDSAYESMLRTEFGAMNAAYADLFELTGNQDYLWLAKRFSDHALFMPAARGEHILPGLHANTQIAKAYGYARVGIVAHEDAYIRAAAHLCQQVVDLHTYSFGGNSVREHFTHSLHDGINSEQGPETCNTYNMLRLTRELLDAPAEVLAEAGLTTDKLLDYYERALFNHILSSQHAETGGLVYFTPVRPDHYRVYSSVQECFWCCVGTGMENHARYPELIYGRDGDTFCVNLGIASRAHDAELALTVEQTETLTDSSDLVLRIVEAPETEVAIAIRLPWWSRRNNQTSWRTEKRVWHSGDELRIPLAKRTTAHIIKPTETEPLTWVSILRGPFVMAAPTTADEMPGLFADDARMGHVAAGPVHSLSEMPVVVSEEPYALGLVDQVKVIFPQDVETALEDSALHAALAERVPSENDPTVALTVSVLGAGSSEAGTGASVEVDADADSDRDALVTGAEVRTSVVLEPLYTVHGTRYTTYFPLVKHSSGSEQADPEQQAQLIAETRNCLRELDAVTLIDSTNLLDSVEAGEQQPESDHVFEGIKANVCTDGTVRWREAASGGAFSYQLRTRGEAPASLRLSLGHQDEPSDLTVKVNGKEVEHLKIPARPIEAEPPFDAEIVLPGDLVLAQDAGEEFVAEALRVEFSPKAGTLTPRIYQVRLLK